MINLAKLQKKIWNSNSGKNFWLWISIKELKETSREEEVFQELLYPQPVLDIWVNLFKYFQVSFSIFADSGRTGIFV